MTVFASSEKMHTDKQSSSLWTRKHIQPEWFSVLKILRILFTQNQTDSDELIGILNYDWSVFEALVVAVVECAQFSQN